MKVHKLSDMLNGWFVGNFEPTVYKSSDFEVGYRTHPQGFGDPHYHTVVTEVNLITQGKMILHDQELSAGDIFVLEPWEITNPEFLEDTSIVCVKMPSINDKKPLTLG